MPDLSLVLPSPTPTITITLTPDSLVHLNSNIQPDLQGSMAIAQACLDAAQMVLKQLPALLPTQQIIIQTPPASVLQ